MNKKVNINQFTMKYLYDEVPIDAFDCPDVRDYKAELILGDTEIEIPEIIRHEFKEGNQGANEKTKVACTHYAGAHCLQYANEQEHKRAIMPDFFIGWDLQKAYGTYSAQGDLVQTALKSFKDNGLHDIERNVYLVEGYAKIKKDMIDYWLARGFNIYTSTLTTDVNYKKAKHEGIWGGIEGTVKGGHAICITGKEPEYKIVSNSYGPEWGFFDDGTFKIKEEDVKHINTCYIIYDKIDMEYIFKDVVDNGSESSNAIKWCKEQGLLQGYQDGRFGPTDPLTREQYALTLYRQHGNK